MHKLALALVLAASALAVAAQLPPPPEPPGNPVTLSKANLGKALFWDEQLSSGRTVACGTCHAPSAGGVDRRTNAADPSTRNPGPDLAFGTADDVVASPGVSLAIAGGTYQLDPSFRLRPQVTGRRALSMVDAAYLNELFWDGRAIEVFIDPLSSQVEILNGAALESQVLEPPVSSAEMGHIGRDWNDVAARVAASQPLALAENLPWTLATWIAGRSYPELFLEAFGASEVTPVRIAMAIATYERTLFSGAAPIDQFLAGDPLALTPLEQEGFDVFEGAGGCNGCHVGPRFTDDAYRFIGVRPPEEDLGRFGVTGNVNDRGSFRTPTLRNIELRAPYFHNGSAASLDAVVAFYNRGGDFDAPNKSHLIQPLGLTFQQMAALVAFLGRPLTDPRLAQEAPPFDRPRLWSESDRVPAVFGVGSAGSGGAVPEMIAREPPAGGNPAMVIAVDRARAGSRAILAIDTVGDPAGRPYRGTTLYLGLSGGLQIRRIGSLGGLGPGDGWGSVLLSLPNDPASIGRTYYAQWYVIDPGAPFFFASSPAVEFTLF